MSRSAPVEPQVVLKRPVITFNFVAENIRSGVIPPLNGVASPYLAWDVHRDYQLWTKLRLLDRFCCLDPS
jgi:hypothetical protein